MAGHSEDRQTRVEILETPHTPRDGSRAAELEAELRSARELLAYREAREGSHRPMMVPSHAVAIPRHRDLSERALRDLIKRLERDLDDLDRSEEAFERLAAEDDDA